MLEPESFSESKYLFSPSPDGDSIIPALRLDVAFCTAAVVLPTGLTFYCITPPHSPITQAIQTQNSLVRTTGRDRVVDFSQERTTKALEEPI